MEEYEEETPAAHIICHCGKCQVRCNKHGKRATCADCKKRRVLGTIVENGVMRHICNQCSDENERKISEEQEWYISGTLADLRKGNS